MKMVHVAVGVFVVGALYWGMSSDPGMSKVRAGKLEKEQWITVERGDLLRAVECTGRVEPALDVAITCKAGGEVVSVCYDISDTVKKGDLLLELDPREERNRYRQAEASVTASQARLDRAKADLLLVQARLDFDVREAKAELAAVEAEFADAKIKAQRVKALFRDKSVSQEELETAQLTLELKSKSQEMARIKLDRLDSEKMSVELKRQDMKLAEAQVSSDLVSLELSKQRLDDIKVFAPIDGTISARLVQPGQIIASAMSNVSGGTQLLIVSDLSRLFVVAFVDESDIGNVLIGQQVRITADAFVNEKFIGKVVRIATKGVTVSDVVTFEVKIEVVSNNKSLLRPEMTANVVIVAGERKNVLQLPLDAVRRRGKKCVVMKRLAKPEKTGKNAMPCPIATGIDDGIRIEIVSGLSEGDEVLLPGGGSGRWSKRDSSGRNQRRAMGAVVRGLRGR